MSANNPRLGEIWDPTAADREPTPAALDIARRIIRSTPLPATVEVLARSGFGRARFRQCLVALEARGEARLSRRGDAVFAFTPRSPDDCTFTSRTVAS